MATIPPKIDTPDGSDSDSNQDSRYYLLKINEKSLLGNRSNGEPIAFFDENDLGVLHSSALLQKLSPDEFKFGEAGQLKNSWVNYLKSGSETFELPQVRQGPRIIYTAFTYTLTWSTNVDTSDPSVEAKELEVNWANSILNQWSIGFQDGNFGAPPRTIQTDLWINIKQTLENHANTSKFINSSDELKTYLNELANDSATETSLPGSPDTILWSREAYHELGLSPGTILDEINRIYGSKDVFTTNQGTLKSLADSINVFQYDLQSRVGMVIDGVETITGYENINNGSIVESIPDGENSEDYQPLSYIFPVYDDFQQKVFGGLSSNYTLVSGIMYNNSLIKNQTISGLADTPSGNISGMLLVSNGSGFEYVSHTLTGLSDTPTGYLSGYYLRSHASGFEYVSPEDFGESVGQFTGLSDTPSGYVGHSGQYLVVNNGETGIHFTGIKKIAQDLTDYGFVGGTSDFTGLQDTPSDYNSGYYLRSTDNGIEYTEPADLGKDIFTYTTGLASGYLRIDDDGTGIVFVDRETFKDEIDLQSDFTGLLDTPDNYSEGDYLRSTSNGLEYVTASGLAQDIGDEIVNNIVTGDLLAFTGLNDTPENYVEGSYIQSTVDGLIYVDPAALGTDVITNTTGLASGYLRIDDDGTGIVFVDRETFKEEIDLQSDFTGLLDTPDNYSEGDYLRSTSNGLEYVTASGLAQDIGDEIVNNIITGDLLGFTGLNDTPENYETGKFVRVNSAGDAVEYSDISFLNDIVDAPENQLVSGYLQLDKNGKLVWSPATTDGDVSYTITGATHFTGLLDTPTGYEHGQYLRVHPSDKKLEYISVTGLAQDIGDEIVNNIISNDLLAFTGLNDTPENYIDGSYVKSTTDGLIYVNPATLGQDVLANTTGLASGYLRIDDDGTGIVIVDRETFKDEIDLRTDFTGLQDTPSDYNSGYYLRSTENGIEYTEPSKLGQDVLTNTTGLASGYLRIDDDGTGIVIVDRETFKDEIDLQTDFTGLLDTPSKYLGHSGDYLVVNDGESGINFTGIEKIAQDLTDYGFGGGAGPSNFTGLQDTPSDYNNGAYLRSTTNGLEYAGIEPTYYNSITELPASAASYNGEVVRVGCDLYLSCDGVWKKFTQYQSDTIDDPNDIFPECVETTAEALQYQQYFDEVMAERNSSSFIDSLNGTSTNSNLKSVCLFKKDLYNSVVWGSEESWVTRGFPSMGNSSAGMRKGSNYSPKFKIGSDQLFFVNKRNSTSPETIDLIVGKINDSFQYEEVWRKRVNNVGFEGVVDITDDFKHIIHSQNRGSSTTVYDIHVLDNNETTGGYEQNRPPITIELAQSLYSVIPFSSNSHLGILPFRISQDGKRVFVMLGHGTLGNHSLRLFIFEWNGTDWILPYVMNMPTPKDGAATMSKLTVHSFCLNQDESIIYLIGGNIVSGSVAAISGGVFRINYENVSIGPQMGQNFINHQSGVNVSINNLGNIITSQKIDTSPCFIWKYDENDEIWEQIATIEGGAVRNVSMCRNGKFFFQEVSSIGRVYFYNESTKSLIQIGQNLSVSPFGKNAAISDSGQSIAYPHNTATIPLSQIPEVEGDIYNNSVSIQESSYKWGLFEENTTINLSGTIDTNCTFTEWQSSDVILTNPSNINATANINQDASITGVFNCG